MPTFKYKKLNINLYVGILLTLLVAAPVVISLFWQAYDPNEINYSEILQSPSLKHVFGTDDYGRDIYSRVMNGAGTTFAISLFTVFAGAAIGTLIGALTGYFGGIVDEILMRVNDCLASFPSILLALVVVSLLDKGTWNICIALGIVFIPSFARIMRAEFLKEKNRDYVLNARLMGAGHFRVIFVHIFPNTLPILFSSMLVGLNNAVLAEAGLSYLGLGVQPPDPSLGRMLSEAKTFIFGAPWYEVTTCLVMIVFLLGITLISENVGVSGVNLSHVKKRIDKMRREEEEREKCEGRPAAEGMVKAEATDAETSEDALLNPEVPAEDPNPPIVKVCNLSVGFIEEEGIDPTLKNISFELDKGEILGVVGESGSGKSLTAMSIMGILAEKAAITGGKILLSEECFTDNRIDRSKLETDENGFVNLTELPESEFRKIRGGSLAYVFQEPMTSLNPVQRIGVQIDEILDIHAPQLSESEHQRIVLEAMEDTGLHQVEKLYDMYPHELSGGMRQRVIIAMALVAKAKIIIADEPTTALDANVADTILDIFKKINRKYGTSIIIISHDLRVIGKLADRALIMQDGVIVETMDVRQEDERVIPIKNKKKGKKYIEAQLAKMKQLECTIENFSEPETEYGKRLLDAAFTTKTYVEQENDNAAAPKETEIRKKPKQGSHGRNSKQAKKDRKPVVVDTDCIVELKNVSVSYKNRANSKSKFHKVIKNVSLKLTRNETAGFVGESGCGKSTLVKAIAGLQRYVEGEILRNCEMPAMVFQDPYSSLNPAFTVERILMEPLLISRKKGGEKLSKQQMRERVLEMLRETELEEEIAKRRISELSGGQRQRIAIALTLILNRELIILDEPVSALDVTIQEQILELLMRLKAEYGLTYILISHDERLVARICDKVYTVKEGYCTLT